MIQTIRTDHSQFSRYQHSSRLVAMLNSFARTEYDLPDSWEKKVERKSGKVRDGGRRGRGRVGSEGSEGG